MTCWKMKSLVCLARASRCLLTEGYDQKVKYWMQSHCLLTKLPNWLICQTAILRIVLARSSNCRNSEQTSQDNRAKNPRKLFPFPTLSGGLGSNILALIRSQFFGSRPPSFDPAQPSQRDGGGVFRPRWLLWYWLRRRLLPSGQRGDVRGQLIRIERQLA